MGDCFERMWGAVPKLLRSGATWMTAYVGIVIWFLRDHICVYIGDKADGINDFILAVFEHSSGVLPWITAILIAVLTAAYIYREKDNRHLTAVEIIAPLIALHFLSWQDWTFCPVVSRFDIGDVLKLSCAAFFIFSLYKCLMQYSQNRHPAVETKGFINSPSQHIDDGREEFAETIAEKIIATDCAGESMAIGISGKWGSGKTIFLRHIGQRLADDFIVVGFNPWESSSPEAVIENFFSKLGNELSPYNHSIPKIFKKYALNLINDEYSGPLSNSLTRFLGRDNSENGAELRAEIETVISSLDRRVAVLIDDIDRLDKEEIIETLRLIRNTASFRNLVYVVAYDSEYVIKMLSSAGISNPYLYLEKIINVEFTLPSFEDYFVPVLIYRIISEVYPKVNRPEFRLIKRALETRTKSGRYFVPTVIRTYRQALRFANSFAAVMEFLERDNELHYLNLSDLFWIELIRYCHPDDYASLSDSPESILSISDDRYVLPEKSLSSSADILRLIFSRRYHGQADMAYRENFKNYFALRPLNDSISVKEFKEIMRSAERTDRLTEWLNRRPSVIDAVRFRFKATEIALFDSQQTAEYLDFFFQWFSVSKDMSLRQIIRTRFRKGFKSIDDATRQRLITEAYRNRFKPDRENITLCASIVSAFGAEKPQIVDEDFHDNCILSGYNLKELAEEIYAQFSDTIKTEDIWNQESDLYKFLRAIGFADTIDMWNNDIVFEEYNHIIGGHISERLESLPQSKNLKDFVNFYALDPSEAEYAYDEPQICIYQIEKINRIFGNLHNLKKFIDKCFDASPDEKSKAYKALSTES